jgi:hypothetical protein
MSEISKESVEFFEKWLDAMMPGQRQNKTKAREPYFVLVRETPKGYLVKDNRCKPEPQFYEVETEEMLADIALIDACRKEPNVGVTRS